MYDFVYDEVTGQISRSKEEGLVAGFRGFFIPLHLLRLDLKKKSKDSDDEAMLSRKLQRILAKKKFGSKRYFKRDKKKEAICYECNQLGQFKSECPKLKKKDLVEKYEKKKGIEKKFRKYKMKAMAAAWDNEEATCSDSSSSESEEEEQVNLALMAGLDQVASFLEGSECELQESVVVAGCACFSRLHWWDFVCP
ncbi:hypothetical protein Taro_040325 [Colocasia esculenta]|uniref:CCHC-type domain-containing protein n=1 Tax=Colocasia esculenta TaxID=4460 RepID=A0A843WSP3_COLES|nr:hypothetical protein [Colocasia esculenta]